jgi:hypothetical protein
LEAAADRLHIGGGEFHKLGCFHIRVFWYLVGTRQFSVPNYFSIISTSLASEKMLSDEGSTGEFKRFECALNRPERLKPPAVGKALPLATCSKTTLRPPKSLLRQFRCRPAEKEQQQNEDAPPRRTAPRCRPPLMASISEDVSSIILVVFIFVSTVSHRQCRTTCSMNQTRSSAETRP